MSRYAARPLLAGWQIARRPDGYWLQQQGADGRWQDVRGPYSRYQAAYAWWARHGFLEATPRPYGVIT
jgi:hypothetical protein